MDFDLTKTIVEFRLGGFTKPIEEILSKLSMKPDKVHKKGDNRGGSCLKHKEDWFVYSIEAAYKEFDEMAIELVNRVHQHKNNIIEACGDFDAQLSCIFYFNHDTRPSMYFPVDIVQKLKEFNAGIDVDIYPLPNDEDEDE